MMLEALFKEVFSLTTDANGFPDNGLKLAEMDPGEERKRFLIKNYSHNNDLFEDDLKEALKNENWEIAARELGPAFQLLNEMSTTAPAVLDNTYRNTLSENQRIVLDQLIAYAFLRKTSKLGLEFAQEKGIPVLVVWKVPGEETQSI